MLSITVSFGSHDAYSVPALSLTGAAHELKVEFQEGEHVFRSPDFELGTIHAMRDTPLVGRLIFRYNYDKENGAARITVCDADYESADGMTLMTFPRAREDASCFERASGAGFAADEIHHNGVWNTRSPLLPGASQLFKDIARDATRAIITALAEHPDVLLKLRTPFPNLPPEEYKKLCLVYRNGELLGSYDEISEPVLRSGKGTFEFWDVFSQFGGTQQVAFNMTFANVIGSTGDPLPGGGSWLGLWNSSVPASVSPATVCASLGFAQPPPAPAGCVQGARLVGGHIIRQATAATRPPGANDVNIIPICSGHNHTSFIRAMAAQRVQWVVLLLNYRN